MTIQSGFVEFSKDTYPQLFENDPPGQRTVQTFVFFTAPFASPPKVVASICSLDARNSSNTRITIFPGPITEGGFDLMATTWEDSQVSSVGVTWIAYGD